MKKIYTLLLLCFGLTCARGAEGDVTTNVDIDFSNPIAGNYSIAGTVGAMTWSQQWTFAPSVVDGVLHFGNFNGGVVALQNANIGEKDVVTISFDMAFGKLTGKHVGFEFKNTDEEVFLTQWFDAYNGDFDESNPLGLDWNYMYRGSNTVLSDRTVKFVIKLDYLTRKITTTTSCYMSGTGKPVTSGEFIVDMPTGNATISQFVLQGNISNAERYSTIDNLKITTTEGNYENEYSSYTINYYYGGEIIKTTDGTTVVNTEVDADPTITVGDTKYFITEESEKSLTISDNAEDNVLNVYLRVAESYVYNVYAVNSSNVKLQDAPIAAASIIEGEEETLTWGKYIQIGDRWYVTDEALFQTTENGSGTKNVVYKESNISYFYEMESLSRSGGAYLTETSESYSGGSRLRLSKGSVYSTSALEGGKYELIIPWQNGNTSSSEVYIYTRDAGGNLSEEYETLIATNGTGTFSKKIAVPEGGSLVLKGNEGSSANNNARMDYMTLTYLTEQITIASGSTGLGSYVTTDALDFSKVDGLKAYVATAEKTDKVMITPVTEVPARTAIFVRGTAGETYPVPVGTCETLAVTNLLQGNATTGHTVADGETIYALMASTGKLAKVNEGVTIPEKKAYLVSTGGSLSAKAISFTDEEDEEATAVATVETEAETGAKRLFNAAGQQVGAGYKGLVIDENGKKYVRK